MNVATVETLRQAFSGSIVLPDDSAYESARATFLYKGSPALVLQPKTSADVALAIQYARDNPLLLSIRSGGHSGVGFGTNDGGVVIDLSAMNKVEIVEPQKHLVRVGAGATWGQVAKELQPHQLALSSGDTVTVGVGGLTLGGGIGWMVRKHGLTIDSLTAAEVVIADGTILQASASEHPDLFWAIRGGGGNFGVVTHFTFAAHPVSKVWAGTISYQLDTLAEVLRGWRDHMRTVSEDLTTMFLIMPAFGDTPPAATIICCFAGEDETAAMDAINPLLKLGTVVKQDIHQKHYAEVLEEGFAPPGIRIVVSNAFAKAMSDELIQAIVAESDKKAGMILQIRSVGGAMNRIASDATAFAHRDSEALLVMPCFVPPQFSESEIHNAVKVWQSFAPFTSGAYVNFFDPATGQDPSAVYPGGTYKRLATIKKTYDPQNVFNRNFNIPPTPDSRNL